MDGESLAKSQVEGKGMKATLVPKRRQRDEGGEEAMVMPRVYGQDPIVER